MTVPHGACTGRHGDRMAKACGSKRPISRSSPCQRRREFTCRRHPATLTFASRKRAGLGPLSALPGRLRPPITAARRACRPHGPATLCDRIAISDRTVHQGRPEFARLHGGRRGNRKTATRETGWVSSVRFPGFSRRQLLCRQRPRTRSGRNYVLEPPYSAWCTCASRSSRPSASR